MVIEYLHILIMLTLVVGIIFFKNSKSNSSYKWVMLLTLLNLIAEIIANILWIAFKANNTIVYNIVVLYNFTIWLWIFTNSSQKVLVVIFMIWYAIDLYSLHGIHQFTSYAFLVGTYLVVFLQLQFFYTNFIIQQNDLTISISAILLRLICLLYHVGFATLLFINDWGATEFYVFKTISLYQLLGIIINTIFYGMLIVYFILQKTTLNALK